MRRVPVFGAGGLLRGDRLQMSVAVGAGAGNGNVRPLAEHIHRRRHLERLHLKPGGAADRGDPQLDAFARGGRVAGEIPAIRAPCLRFGSGLRRRVGGKITVAGCCAAKRAVGGAVTELIGIAAVFAAGERYGVVCVFSDVVVDVAQMRRGIQRIREELDAAAELAAGGVEERRELHANARFLNGIQLGTVDLQRGNGAAGNAGGRGALACVSGDAVVRAVQGNQRSVKPSAVSGGQVPDRIIDADLIGAAVGGFGPYGRLGVIGVIVGFFELQLGRAVRHIYRVVFGRFEDAFGRSVPLPVVPAARDEVIRLLGVNADRGKVQLAVQRDDLPFGEIYVLAEQIGAVLPNDHDILYGHAAVVPYAAAVTCGTVLLRVEQA